MRRLFLGVLISAPVVLSAQAPAPSSAPPVRPPSATVTAVSVNAGPVVVITGAGGLPSPRIGMLHAPERIYLDLVGVSTRTLRTSGDGVVTLVRAAQNSLDPLIARVVIDLEEPCRYSLDTSRRAAGHIELTLTPGPPMPARPSAAPAPPSTPQPRASRYVARLQPVLADLTVLRTALQQIDKRMAPPPDRIDAAQLELNHLRETVESLRPPRSLADAHDLLKTVAAFASTALSLTTNSTGPVPSNAASAAAGALLMLDRAQAQLTAGGAVAIRQSL